MQQPSRSISLTKWHITGIVLAAISGVVIGATLVVACLSLGPIAFTAAADPDKEAVRGFLRSHLNDPEFEEVNWKKSTKNSAAEYLVAIKYRSRNGFGAKILSTDIFRFRSGVIGNRLNEIEASQIPESEWLSK